VSLNDLERSNSPNDCVILPNSVDFWADYVKVVEDTPILLRQKCRPKNVSDIHVSLIVILARDQP